MSRTQQLSPAGSIERDEPVADGPMQKTRRPPNTAFRQQRLKAWQPILTPKTVLPLLFAVGVIFAPIGGLLLYASGQVQELIIDYTDCVNAPSGNGENIPTNQITSYLSSNTSDLNSQPATWSSQPYNVSIGLSGSQSYSTNNCTIEFTLPEDLKPPVFMYYQLTNFYQNHRRYAQSYDQDQLAGKPPSSLSTCDPLNTVGSQTIYPCGLIPNSLFNDTIGTPVWLNPRGVSDSQLPYDMITNGTAWATDAALYVSGNDTGYNISDIVPPPNWILRYPEGYTSEFPIPDLNTDDVFQNWMRAAGLPTFSKLYRHNNNDVMQSGRYQINVTYDFPVADYGGRKAIILSTRTVMGGRNPSLGITYIVVAALCVLLGAVFTVAHLVKPRKLGDHTYLSWNSDKPSTATTTGRAPRPNETA